MSHNFKTLANPFSFDEIDVLTAIDERGMIWFNANDICAAVESDNLMLDIVNCDMPKEWELILDVNGHTTLFLNVLALFRILSLLLTCKADKFLEWVVLTVMPEFHRSFIQQVFVERESSEGAGFLNDFEAEIVDIVNRKFTDCVLHPQQAALGLARMIPSLLNTLAWKPKNVQLAIVSANETIKNLELK